MTEFKKIALASAAAAAFIATGTAASAQGWSPEDFYLKGFGGASFVQDEDVDTTVPQSLADLGVGLDLELDYDTGYILGAAVGYEMTPNVAWELEYAYRSANATTSGDFITPDGREPIEEEDGDTVANAVMVNAIYSFDGMGAMQNVRPYLGAGIGGATVDFDGDDTDFEFAWQAMAGVAYDISPSWSLYSEARYFSTDGGEFLNEDGFSADAGFESVDLLVGAAYKF